MLVNPADLVIKAKTQIRECSIEDVSTALEGDTILVDIREPVEFQRGHIPGAIHLPRGMLEYELHNLVAHCRKDMNPPLEEQTVVLYCASGGRSALAAVTAEALGYRHLDGKWRIVLA